MSLDNRSKKIFNTIVNNPMITGKQIQSDLNLTRKQLGYSIEKINSFLLANGYNKIGRLKTGKFVVDKEIINGYKQSGIAKNTSDYIFSESERISIIIMLLLQHNDDLSLNHFTYVLKVSKNTLLNDLKKVQKTISEIGSVELYNNRQRGYFLVGSEYEKRKLIVYIVNQVLKILDGEELLININCMNREVLSNLKKDLIECECRLKLNFTDDIIRSLPFILYLNILRIQKGKRIDALPEGYQHIFGTNEYNIAQDIFKKYRVEDVLEIQFLVSLFQISNISLVVIDEESSNTLMHTANEVINKFENLIQLKIKDKKNLLEALIQHLRPAIYRLKYGYHVDNSILNLIMNQHSYLHEIVKRSISPIEELIKKPFPDEKLAYLTILFGGWLTKEGVLKNVENKKRAIVVCTNGISISNYLFNNLRELFPEFTFIETLSLRDFNSTEIIYDIVFTTIPLTTDKSQFFVKPVMDEITMRNLRNKVFNQLRNINSLSLDYNALMSIIDKNCEIKDIKNLKKDLKQLLGYKDQNETTEITDSTIGLEEVLNKDAIKITDHINNWEEALYSASEYLLQHNYIREEYVEKMIDEIKTNKPIWTIADKLVLAHSGIENGVNKLGVSILKVNQEIVINDYMTARYIIVLATPSRKIHLKCLYNIIDLTEDEDDYHTFLNSNSIDEIYELMIKER